MARHPEDVPGNRLHQDVDERNYMYYDALQNPHMKAYEHKELIRKATALNGKLVTCLAYDGNGRWYRLIGDVRPASNKSSTLSLQLREEILTNNQADLGSDTFKFAQGAKVCQLIPFEDYKRARPRLYANGDNNDDDVGNDDREGPGTMTRAVTPDEGVEKTMHVIIEAVDEQEKQLEKIGQDIEETKKVAAQVEKLKQQVSLLGDYHGMAQGITETTERLRTCEAMAKADNAEVRRHIHSQAEALRKAREETNRLRSVADEREDRRRAEAAEQARRVTFLEQQIAEVREAMKRRGGGEAIDVDAPEAEESRGTTQRPEAEGGRGPTMSTSVPGRAPTMSTSVPVASAVARGPPRPIPSTGLPAEPPTAAAAQRDQVTMQMLQMMQQMQQMQQLHMQQMQQMAVQQEQRQHARPAQTAARMEDDDDGEEQGGGKSKILWQGSAQEDRKFPIRRLAEHKDFVMRWSFYYSAVVRECSITFYPESESTWETVMVKVSGLDGVIKTTFGELRGRLSAIAIYSGKVPKASDFPPPNAVEGKNDRAYHLCYPDSYLALMVENQSTGRRIIEGDMDKVVAYGTRHEPGRLKEDLARRALHKGSDALFEDEELVNWMYAWKTVLRFDIGREVEDPYPLKTAIEGRLSQRQRDFRGGQQQQQGKRTDARSPAQNQKRNASKLPKDRCVKCGKTLDITNVTDLKDFWAKHHASSDCK